MASEEVSVTLPAELVQELDAWVGADKRNNLIAELARNALHTHRVFQKLMEEGPIWKDEDHPELVELGTEGWVRSLREESEERFRRVHSER